jgi:hypothetical protein
MVFAWHHENAIFGGHVQHRIEIARADCRGLCIHEIANRRFIVVHSFFLDLLCKSLSIAGLTLQCVLSLGMSRISQSALIRRPNDDTYGF